MKNLLITGGCGFIGCNFIRMLFEKPGFQGQVTNLDALTYSANPANLADVEEQAGNRYRLVHLDLTEGAAVRALLETLQPDVIVHFAAESHVDRSIHGPQRFIESNILGTFHLLEASRGLKSLQRFHHVSTDEVYGELGPTGAFTEQTPYHPNSPYSASKAASDHLVRAYHHTYGLPVTLSNCSNNYGPYQFPEKLIPLMILNALEGKPLPVYGNGMNVRDWLYVGDHCQAIWRVLEDGRDGETYNIGGGTELPNLEVVRMICRLADQAVPANAPHEKLITFVKDRPGHDLRYAIDASKIERELGWTPTRDFEQGLADTLRWYQDQRAWVDSIRSGAYQEWITRHYGA